MTSSNGNIFRVTGHLCGEFTGPGEFPTQSPVTRSFGVFFDQRLNKRLSNQPCGWWFETLSWSLWRHCNAFIALEIVIRPDDWVTIMRFSGVRDCNGVVHVNVNSFFFNGQQCSGPFPATYFYFFELSFGNILFICNVAESFQQSFFLSIGEWIGSHELFDYCRDVPYGAHHIDSLNSKIMKTCLLPIPCENMPRETHEREVGGGGGVQKHKF